MGFKIKKDWWQLWDQKIKGRHSIKNRLGIVRKYGGNRKQEAIIQNIRTA